MRLISKFIVAAGAVAVASVLAVAGTWQSTDFDAGASGTAGTVDIGYLGAPRIRRTRPFSRAPAPSPRRPL